MPDEVRRLGKTGDYVPDRGRALAAEPLEAVSAAVQEELTAAVHRKVRDEKIDRRSATAAEMQRELAHIDARGRYLRRQLKRLAR